MASNRVEEKLIRVPLVRLSFPVLDEPVKGSNSDAKAKPKYAVNLLLDPKDPVHLKVLKEINGEIQRVIKEAWGTPPPKMKPINEIFGKGELQTHSETGKVYEGYEGMYFLRCKSVDKPRLLDRYKQKVEYREPGNNQHIADMFYAGCRVHALVSMYKQDNEPDKGGKAVRCSLKGLQFARDDEPFGGGIRVQDSDFDAFSEFDECYETGEDFGLGD